MNKRNEFWDQMFTIGTRPCAILGGVSALLCAALLLSIGFWRVFFLAIFVAAGIFIGGVTKKVDVIRHVINRIFPPHGTKLDSDRIELPHDTKIKDDSAD